jgi:hypothetical protein
MDIPWDNMDGLLGGNWLKLLVPGTPLFEKYRVIAEQSDAKRRFREQEQRFKDTVVLRP